MPIWALLDGTESYSGQCCGRNWPKSDTVIEKIYKTKTSMNKQNLINAPIGAGIGAVVYSGYANGFAHLNWHAIVVAMVVAFIISLSLSLFSRQKK